jgi:exodeoxyribonuclease V alpha subunit
MTTRFYYPPMYAAEREIAAHLHRLLANPCDKLTGVTDTLKGDQPRAVEMACRYRASVLYGRPGTGKTTTVASVIQSYDKAGLKGLVLSPTAKAAKRAAEVIRAIEDKLSNVPECMTIHRGLEFNPRLNKFMRNAEDPLDVDYVVGEEWSMADVPIAAEFLGAIDPLRTRLLFLGDPYQLPSVGPGNVLHDMINSRVIPRVELKTIYRTGANSGIAYNAGRILEGEMPIKDNPETGEQFSDFYFVHREKPEQTAEFILESVRDKIPRQRGFDPITDIQVLSPGKKSEVGTTALNKRLRDVLNPGKDVYKGFRLGDKVINRKNNMALGVVNGDVGKVVEIGRSGVTVDFGPGAGNDGSGVVEFSEDKEWSGDSLFHAYCFTIHSSQGSEFPAVIIPCHKSHYKLLFRNLIYTGMTRAKKLSCIVGDINALRHAIETSVTDKRITGLQEWLKLNPPTL